MKSLQLIRTENFHFEEVVTPSPDATEVLLRICKVGICGTDLHRYHYGDRKVSFPLVLGHEFVGEVVQTGADVTRAVVGDRVVAEHVLGCDECFSCRTGHSNTCSNPTVYGLTKPGALAEYMVVPEKLVYKIPEELSNDQAVLVEPLSIAVYAVNESKVKRGDRVCVIGQGPLGLLIDQVLMSRGVEVLGMDILQHRIDFALAKGFISGKVDLNSMESVTHVFEAAGQQETLQNALSIVRSRGSVIVLGVFATGAVVDMLQIVRRELTIRGISRCLNTFQQTIDLLCSGRLNLDGFITHRYSFEDAQQAFVEASSYSENRIKSIIEFD